MRFCAACRPSRSWPRCSARRRAARAGAAGRCTCSTRRPASTAATPSSVVTCRSPSASALADQMLGAAERGHVCFFGEGAMAEGEFHEAMNLAALWNVPGAVLLREQPLRDGHVAGVERVADRPRAQGGELRDAGMERRRHGRDGGAPGDHEGADGDPGRRRPDLPRVPDLPIPGPLDVRPRPVPRPGRGRAVEGARSDRRRSPSTLLASQASSPTTTSTRCGTPLGRETDARGRCGRRRPVRTGRRCRPRHSTVTSIDAADDDPERR